MRLCRRHAWRCALALSMLVLVACTTVQGIRSDAVDAFSRTGRFALTVQTSHTAPQATQGGFAWLDDDHTLRVNFSTPLGSVLAQLRVEAGRAVLVRHDGTQVDAPTPDALLALVLGRAVPVSGLRAWLHGQVAQHATAVQHDDIGHILAFTQDGWQVQLSRFDAHGPRLLRLTRNEPGGERVQLRLALDGE